MTPERLAIGIVLNAAEQALVADRLPTGFIQHIANLARYWERLTRCPSFTNAPAEVQAQYDYGAPSCNGLRVRGSGGHRMHAGCGRPATWWHPDDCFSYCDEHCPEGDKIWYLRDWSDTWEKLK